eukprot:TRINITY_DN2165_c0_g2_i1.p1 TRINITY_DN2165_c0_g2~~TRINITY_DN2165_c0_g2_i1.p1  ORF type:complete len:561 (+),score=103.48 TRINITY_DN2165_c0_g2_i1:95-1684(+)
MAGAGGRYREDWAHASGTHLGGSPGGGSSDLYRAQYLGGAPGGGYAAADAYDSRMPVSPERGDPALGSSPPPGPGRDPGSHTSDRAAERHGIAEGSAPPRPAADSPERWAGGAARAARGVPRAGGGHRHGAGSRYSALYSQSPVDPNVQWLYHDGTTLRPFNDYFNIRLEEAYKLVKGGQRAGGYGLKAAEVYVTIGRDHYYADVEKMSARRGADFRGQDQPVMLRRVDLCSLGMDDSLPPEFRSAAEGSDAVQDRALGGEGTQPEAARSLGEGTQPGGSPRRDRAAESGDVSPQRRSGSPGSERGAAGSPPARGGPHTPPPESPRAGRDPAHSAPPGDAAEHHSSGEMADRPPTPPRGPESPRGQVQPPPAGGSDAGSGRQRAHQTPQAAGAPSSAGGSQPSPEAPPSTVPQRSTAPPPPAVPAIPTGQVRPSPPAGKTPRGNLPAARTLVVTISSMTHFEVVWVRVSANGSMEPVHLRRAAELEEQWAKDGAGPSGYDRLLRPLEAPQRAGSPQGAAAPAAPPPAVH